MAGLRCTMVPRQVEIPGDCQESATCNTCTEYYQNNQGGGCPNNNCDNWYDFNNYTEMPMNFPNTPDFAWGMQGNATIDPIPTINPSPMVPGTNIS